MLKDTYFEFRGEKAEAKTSIILLLMNRFVLHTILLNTEYKYSKNASTFRFTF